MFNKYKNKIETLKDLEWIQKVYKEQVGGLVGYFIQFLDGSFIVGVIKKDRFEYTFVKKKSYLSEEESNAELFVNFIEVEFDGEFAESSFLKSVYKSFGSDRGIDDMSEKELKAEMGLAVKVEDFKKAALIKKKLEEK